MTALSLSRKFASTGAVALIITAGAVGTAHSVPSGYSTPDSLVPLCEGTTDYDPTKDSTYGVEVNLQGLWGQRYTDFQAGHSVPLYGREGTGGGGDGPQPPLCVTRNVGTVAEPVAESHWSYCTDQNKGVCGSYTLGGDITNWPSGQVVGGQKSLTEGNSKLSVLDTALLSYVLSNPIALAAEDWNDFASDLGMEIVGEASNATTATRTARQSLVWCVTETDAERKADEASWNWLQPVKCGQVLTPIMKAVEAEMEGTASLGMTGAEDEVAAGESGTVTVSTNLIGIPLQVATNAEKLEVEGTIAVLSEDGKVLTVKEAGDLTLKVWGEAGSDVSVSLSASKAVPDKLVWSQSDAACQAFARFDGQEPEKFSATANVTFAKADDLEDPEDPKDTEDTEDTEDTDDSEDPENPKEDGRGSEDEKAAGGSGEDTLARTGVDPMLGWAAAGGLALTGMGVALRRRASEAGRDIR